MLIVVISKGIFCDYYENVNVGIIRPGRDDGRDDYYNDGYTAVFEGWVDVGGCIMRIHSVC